jgi:hypothetical protein
MFENLGSADVDDYLYAFDKEDWTTKNYYSIEEREKHKLDSNGYGTQKTDGTWEMEKYNAETLFEDVEIDKINIMRSDMQNYIDIATPKPATKK